ncbi:EAL domain-containing protein [Roseomonas sp. PWR1]|uniref:EAL domain-containing protein n=1 Tax=Roseomonas nitratireducens TaxID=2820810 RepID=A0ABS4AWW9_9PROT|nr:GGDEF and EAL domain-containing protein [Neoroseomonas nitratireducens]MBP0465858.1 EAL domain-containing protein [Neoroseomonas nitratireducens]
MTDAAPGPDAELLPASDRPEDLRAFYESAPCAYLTMRRDGLLLGANRTLLDWTGAELGRPGHELWLRDVLTAASWVVFNMKCLPVATLQGRVNEIALDLRRADGTALPVLASFQRVEQPGGAPPLLRGILFDATERRLYERDLLEARKAADQARASVEASRARLSAILESTTDGVLLVEPGWRLAYANPSAAGLGIVIEPGADIRAAFPRDPEGRFLAAFARAMDGQVAEPVQGLVHGAVWLQVKAFPALGGGITVFFRDVTPERQAEEERQRAAERIRHMATHDPLTGLANRVRFAERLRAALDSTGGRLAVLCLDLDRFKQVNDRLGHPAGDALLQAVASRLRAELRGDDTVARFGGDEFGIVLASAGRSGGDAEAHAEAVAARIVAAVSAPYTLGGERAEIGTSIGIAFAAGRDTTPEALLAEADVALYCAKRAGRGRHAVFEPAMAAEQRTKLEIGEALRQALADGELLLHYQPVVDVATRTVRGHEALVRWDRPGHGLLLPGAFVQVAEETAQISRLGAFALRQACRDAATWPDRNLRVAVNLSPLQLRDPALMDAVADALRDSGLAPSRLELEITEGVLLERTEAVLGAMHRLRAMGVAFAMDDFGTGYSSLACLRSFPFDRVKIDRYFLREAETEEGDAAIIEAVAALCRRLGMTCTAEGVETEGQLRLLARAGCTEAQGYLFGRPVPQEDLLRARMAAA